MSKEKFSLIGEEKREILEDKSKSPEEREAALKVAKEKLDTATDRLQGSKELREYKIEESSEQERVAEQKLISAAQNQYKAINDNYDKLSQEDKMKAIGRIEDYLKELLPIFAEDTEDIKKKMEELKDKIQIDLKENY